MSDRMISQRAIARVDDPVLMHRDAIHVARAAIPPGDWAAAPFSGRATRSGWRPEHV